MKNKLFASLSMLFVVAGLLSSCCQDRFCEQPCPPRCKPMMCSTPCPAPCPAPSRCAPVQQCCPEYN